MSEDINHPVREEEADARSLSADRLKGRQSVRATFRLPVQVIGLLSVAASQLGLKQKSLFDQLVEDRDALTQLAVSAGISCRNEQERKQKTFVISRNALLALEYVAKNFGVPRDLLVEISINRLLPVISAEQEKQKKRREILSKMEKFVGDGMELLEKTCKDLGETDPACQRLRDLLLYSDQTVMELRHQVELSKEIEAYL